MKDTNNVSLRLVPTMAKAIRAKCIDCSAGDPVEVRKCTLRDCPLWQYRFGCMPETAARRGKDVGQHSGR